VLYAVAILYAQWPGWGDELLGTAHFYLCSILMQLLE